MIVLGIDTCLEACSAAVMDGERRLAAAFEPMARGHQERLAPMVEEVMARAGLPFSRLERIAVTVGPGSFTGLRVGLAFAKGLGAALSIPVVGVGTLEALAARAPAGVTVAAVDARRDQVYVQAFVDGSPLADPQALSVRDAAEHVAAHAGEAGLTLVGSGGPSIAPPGTDAAWVEAVGCDAADVARLACSRDPAPPRPLYLRAPDARLPG